MHTKTSLYLACIIAFQFVATLNADIVPTGPFTGSIADDFETYTAYDPNTITGSFDTLSIADGAAELRSVPSATDQIWIYDPSQGAIWGLDDYGFAVTRSGQQGLGFFLDTTPTVTATVDLVLTNPVSRVGIYYATNSNGIANGFRHVGQRV